MIMLPVQDAYLIDVQQQQQQRRNRSTAQASAEYARKKFLRRQTAAAAAAPAPVPLRALPWHKSLDKWDTLEYRTGWARPCSFCGSQLLDHEKNGWCCNQGKWHLHPLEPYPAAFVDFLGQNMQALQSQTCTLNNFFALLVTQGSS